MDRFSASLARRSRSHRTCCRRPTRAGRNPCAGGLDHRIARFGDALATVWNVCVAGQLASHVYIASLNIWVLLSLSSPAPFALGLPLWRPPLSAGLAPTVADPASLAPPRRAPVDHAAPLFPLWTSWQYRPHGWEDSRSQLGGRRRSRGRGDHVHQRAVRLTVMARLPIASPNITFAGPLLCTGRPPRPDPGPRGCRPGPVGWPARRDLGHRMTVRAT